MKSEQLFLSLQCRSGNECEIELAVDCAREIRIRFSWKRGPSPDDREEWRETMFATAADCLREYAFQNRAIVDGLRKLEAAGEIKCVGVDEEGDWEFEGIESQRDGGFN